MPAAVARPVVSVSRQTSGTSGGGWPGSVASRARSTGSGRLGVSRRTMTPSGLRTTSPSTAAASRAASSSAPSRREAPRRRPRRGPIAVETATECRRAVDHGRATATDAPTGAPELREQPQRKRSGVDVGFETRSGAGGAARLAATAR